MPDLDIPLFHGGMDQESESARNFINKMKRAFMSQDYDDAHKVQFFGFSLKDGGPAAEWFAGLPVEQTTTWNALCQAFDERWPARRAIVKSRAEKQEELADTRIKEEELGQKVKVNGVEMYEYITLPLVWAKVQMDSTWNKSNS
ncbi:hypothetical protein H0H92_008761, partial [Tricholoma furcatifolium]